VSSCHSSINNEMFCFAKSDNSKPLFCMPTVVSVWLLLAGFHFCSHTTPNCYKFQQQLATASKLHQMAIHMPMKNGPSKSCSMYISKFSILLPNYNWQMQCAVAIPFPRHTIPQNICSPLYLDRYPTNVQIIGAVWDRCSLQVPIEIHYRQCCSYYTVT